MRTLTLLSVALFAVGCAPAVSSTEVTSADMRAATTESNPGAIPAAIPGEGPPGQLICKVSSIHQGQIELYLDWKGARASGTLRRKAPSGDVTEQKLHAEHVKGAIVADDVMSQDLVVHAATIREHKGHNYVRLGDWKQGWTPCEN